MTRMALAVVTLSCGHPVLNIGRISWLFVPRGGRDSQHAYTYLQDTLEGNSDIAPSSTQRIKSCLGSHASALATM